MKEKTGKVILMASTFFMFTMVGMVIGVGVAPYLPYDNNNSSNDFVSKIIGLECHKLEQYILDMEYRGMM